MTCHYFLSAVYAVHFSVKCMVARDLAHREGMMAAPAHTRKNHATV